MALSAAILRRRIRPPLGLSGTWYSPLATQMGGAADYYVDPTHPDADDTNDGATPDTPWATITKLRTTLASLGNNSTKRAVVRSATYTDQHLDISITGATGITISIAFEADAVIDWTLGTDATCISLATEVSNTLNVYHNGLTIQGFNAGTGNGFGASDSTVRIYAGDTTKRCTVTNCIDGISGHNASVVYSEYCDFTNCTKSAFAHVNTTTYEHVNCTFTGRAAASLGIGSVDATCSGSFTDCTFTPISAGQAMTIRSSTMTRCIIGTTSTRAEITNNTGATLVDCYVNIYMDGNLPITMTRCYGKASIRLRGAPAVTDSVYRNCVFVGNASGLSNGLLYSNFDAGDGNWDGIGYDFRDCIITGYSTAIGAGPFSAGQFSSFNANSKIDNCCTFGNSTGIHASITIETNELTSDPDIGAANTTVQSDYGYAPGSPCIGAGFGGGNIGFAA